jgi:SAM-dependent methyltransferase
LNRQQEPTHDPINQALCEAPGGRLLDLATGSGTYLDYLLDMLVDVTYAVGIDTTLPALKAAYRNLDGDAGVAQMSTGAMGFATDAMDTVSMSNSLHHLPDFVTTFMEIRRVLRPGGRFIFSEMFKNDQSETQMGHVKLHHWAAEVDRALGIPHEETYTREELLVLLSGLDLNNVKSFNYADMDADPLESGKIAKLDKVIDQVKQRAKGLPNERKLREDGEKVRAYIHKVGFQSSTQLVYIGER